MAEARSRAPRHPVRKRPGGPGAGTGNRPARPRSTCLTEPAGPQVKSSVQKAHHEFELNRGNGCAAGDVMRWTWAEPHPIRSGMVRLVWALFPVLASALRSRAATSRRRTWHLANSFRRSAQASDSRQRPSLVLGRSSPHLGSVEGWRRRRCRCWGLVVPKACTGSAPPGQRMHLSGVSARTQSEACESLKGKP